MKYIDADKLIAKIWEICDYASEHWDVEKERGAYDFARRLNDFIDSIQQEQPEYFHKDMVVDAIKLAYGKASMNPFDCSGAFEELLNKFGYEIH